MLAFLIWLFAQDVIKLRLDYHYVYSVSPTERTQHAALSSFYNFISFFRSIRSAVSTLVIVFTFKYIQIQSEILVGSMNFSWKKCPLDRTNQYICTTKPWLNGFQLIVQSPTECLRLLITYFFSSIYQKIKIDERNHFDKNGSVEITACTHRFLMSMKMSMNEKYE